MKDKTKELKNIHDNFFKVICDFEDMLKKEFDDLIKVRVMCKSLDVYLEFKNNNVDIKSVADKICGLANGTYIMEDGRYTYCISLDINNDGVVF